MSSDYWRYATQPKFGFKDHDLKAKRRTDHFPEFVYKYVGKPEYKADALECGVIQIASSSFYRGREVDESRRDFDEGGIRVGEFELWIPFELVCLRDQPKRVIDPVSFRNAWKKQGSLFVPDKKTCDGILFLREKYTELHPSPSIIFCCSLDNNSRLREKWGRYVYRINVSEFLNACELGKYLLPEEFNFYDSSGTIISRHRVINMAIYPDKVCYLASKDMSVQLKTSGGWKIEEKISQNFPCWKAKQMCLAFRKANPNLELPRQTLHPISEVSEIEQKKYIHCRDFAKNEAFSEEQEFRFLWHCYDGMEQMKRKDNLIYPLSAYLSERAFPLRLPNPEKIFSDAPEPRD